MKNKQNKDIKSDCELVFQKASGKLKKLSGSTLLITGGTGFFGSWVSELVFYMNENHKMNVRLYLVDRDFEDFKSSLPHLVESENMKFIRSDIRHLTEIPSEVNYIIHAANNPDNRFHSSRPLESMTTVAEGIRAVVKSSSLTQNLLKIVNISSSSVYSMGKDCDKNFIESDQGYAFNKKIKNCFGEANRYGESLCHAARNEFRLPIINVRPFTFCGAYQSIDSPWAINNFINDAINKRPISIFGDGNTVRSYMYGADLAVWLIIIMLYSEDGKTYNVGNGTGFSLREIAEKVSSFFQPSPSVLLNTSLTIQSNNTLLLPDISKAEKDFGLAQYTDIDRSIKRTVEWYKENLNFVYK